MQLGKKKNQCARRIAVIFEGGTHKESAIKAHLVIFFMYKSHAAFDKHRRNEYFTRVLVLKLNVNNDLHPSGISKHVVCVLSSLSGIAGRMNSAVIVRFNFDAQTRSARCVCVRKKHCILISASGLDSVKRSGRCYVLKSRPKGRHAIFIFQVFFLGKKMPCGAGEKQQQHFIEGSPSPGSPSVFSSVPKSRVK